MKVYARDYYCDELYGETDNWCITDYECEFFQENDDYDDIDGYITSEMNRNSEYKDIKIDCFQKYISYNLVLLIAFLFVIN